MKFEIMSCEPLTETELAAMERRTQSWIPDTNVAAQARRDVPRLIAEVRRLRAALAEVAIIAASPKHREVWQCGYGDIEEIANQAVRQP